MEYFRQYLLRREFKVRTDHAALSWLRSTPELIGQKARWLEQMEEFSFTVEHRAGTKHGNADEMSRRPCTRRNCACKYVQFLDDGFPVFSGPADQSSTLAARHVSMQGDQRETNNRDSVTQELACHTPDSVSGKVEDGVSRKTRRVYRRILMKSR